MTTPHRTRILGDLGENAPERWDWGGPAAPVDAVLLLYAKDDASLAALEQTPPGFSPRQPARHRRPRRLRAVRLPRRDLAAVRRGARQVRPARGDRPRRRVPARLRERVRPDDRRAPAPQRQLPRLPPAEPGRRRLLAFVDEATRRPDGSSNPDARLRLAAKMVGRWPSGAPLALAPDADDPSLAEANDFGYHEDDPRGVRCPVGSHIRRSNPRDSLDPDPGSDRSFEVNRRHRIVRRGREYGPPLPLEQALAGARLGRARPPLHLPERQHRAAVRVRQPHLAEQHQVRRALRRRRPVLRAGLLHDPHRRRPRARDRRAPVRVRQGRRLLLPPRPGDAPLPRRRLGNTSSPVGS